MDDVTDSADDMGKEIDEAADSAESLNLSLRLRYNSKIYRHCDGAVAVAAGAAAVKLGKEVISLMPITNN